MKSIRRSLILVAAIFTASCRTDRTNEQQASTAETSQATVKTAATGQTLVTATATAASPNGVIGEFDIADNFDSSTTLQLGSVQGPSPDAVGAFRFACLAGQLLKDDPLVLPGQPGASHLHQFFGNTGTNANSNYQSLRTTGGTTCGDSSAPVQRTAYWIPAMLDGAGNAVKPDWMNTYYKRLPADHPGCGFPDATHVGICTAVPNGLRFIFGYNMATGAGGPTDTNSPGYGTFTFKCLQREGGAGPGSATGTYYTIAEAVAAGCPANAWLDISAVIPDCWDGKNLDSPDHRSHMAYATGPYLAGPDHRVCPADHPYLIDGLAAQFFFTTDANFVAGKWRLSSDEMMPGTVPGSTMHMDYWEAWSPTIKATWHQYCINGHLSCSSGDLGNGTAVKGMGHPNGSWPTHVLVALSSLGTTTTPPPSTQTCPDGSVILSTATCSTTPTPTPTTKTCPDGSVILSTDTCPTTTKPGKAIGRRK